MIRKYITGFAAVIVLAGCSGTNAGGYNRPSASPSKMSSDTLCYRAAGAKKDEAITDEIRARGLDCRGILENDPLMDMSGR